MNDRRKIVIQTGNDADDSLSTPHFDTEATLTARPVVPLGEGLAGQAYDSRRSRTGKQWNPLLLVLIVVGAVSLGVATGLAIGFYKNRQAATPSVVSQSPSPAPDTNAGQTVETPAPTPLPTPMEEARASVPEVEEEPAVQPKDEKPERAVKDERDERDENRKATPPVVPEKRRASDDDDQAFEENAGEERRAERQRRREERRERRRRERDLEEPAQFPRDIERAGREQINRIRDIFEGRQP